MKQLSVQELAAHCAARPSTLLIDVREAWEVAQAALRLPGIETRHIPLGTLPAALHALDPAQPVVCVCHHGMRSAHAVAFLERHGFGSAWNLAGGIDAWSTLVDASVPRY
jgi:rhodanese-related sulfurtransferase